MGEDRKVYRVLVGKPEGEKPLEDPRVDGRMGSKRILWILAVTVWIGFSWLIVGTGGEVL
jgi:hypothetical protein